MTQGPRAVDVGEAGALYRVSSHPSADRLLPLLLPLSASFLLVGMRPAVVILSLGFEGRLPQKGLAPSVGNFVPGLNVTGYRKPDPVPRGCCVTSLSDAQNWKACV